MRQPIGRMLLGLALASAAFAAGSRADDFQVSYAAGSRDEAGRFAGGTEMRLLVAHAGRLYAGNGYWEDRPGPEGPQDAQILVLDRQDGRWRFDDGFEERLDACSVHERSVREHAAAVIESAQAG